MALFNGVRDIDDKHRPVVAAANSAVEEDNEMVEPLQLRELVMQPWYVSCK